MLTKFHALLPRSRGDAYTNLGLSGTHVFLRGTFDRPRPHGHLPYAASRLAFLRPDDVLVVWKLDRLGRSLVEMMRTIDTLHRDGVCFQSLTEHFDSDTAHGRFALQMNGEKRNARDKGKIKVLPVAPFTRGAG